MTTSFRMAPPLSGPNTTMLANGRTYATPGTRAVGTILFSSNPTTTHTVTLDGTAWTFETSGATGNQVNIGASLAASLAAFAAAVNASTDASTATMTYSVNGNSLICTSVAPGTGGNSLTIATTVTGAVASAATLLGGLATGGFLDVLDFDARILLANGWTKIAETASARPLDVKRGRVWFDKALGQIIVGNGSVWLDPVSGNVV